MLKFTVLALITMTPVLAATPEIEVVYGQDNRQDIYQVTNSLHKTLAQSTAGMIPINQIKKSSAPNTFELFNTRPLRDAENLCSSEPFGDQPVAPICSGFLVGPDVLVTAGHCYKSFSTPEGVCKAFAWVFDYNMKSASSDPTKNISLNNVYLCKQVIEAQLTDSLDFTIIRLDRKVVGRTPLRVRDSGKVNVSEELVVIGHPTGLPTKVSPKGKITKNTEPTHFSTTLDTFHGNSGSAVFDAKTGLVEGILIQGKTDYRPSIRGNEQSCKVVNRCDENASNCSAGVEGGTIANGEVVLRIETIAAKIRKAVSAK
jgi:V8-like Glu-specific endopeptidase